MGNRPQTRLIAIAALAAALCVTPLAAQDTVGDDGSTAVDFALDPSWERFRVSIGGFIMGFDSLIRLDSEEHGIGTEIRFEDDLGVDRDNLDLRIFANYRVGKRSDLTFGYYQWNRGADHVIDEEIQCRLRLQWRPRLRHPRVLTQPAFPTNSRRDVVRRAG